MESFTKANYTTQYSICDEDITLSICNRHYEKQYIAVKNYNEYSKFLDTGVDVFKIIVSSLKDGDYVINDNIENIEIFFSCGKIKIPIRCEIISDTEKQSQMMIQSLKKGLYNFKEKVTTLSTKLKSVNAELQKSKKDLEESQKIKKDFEELQKIIKFLNKKWTCSSCGRINAEINVFCNWCNPHLNNE
jgi:hypothetical protein